MALFQFSFYCWVKMLVSVLISSEGMHLFYQKFAEGYIIVKYRSTILVTICKILVKLWPFFDLVFVVGIRR